MDGGRVYGIGQTSGFASLWSWVWDKKAGLRFLDVDGTMGAVVGATRRFQAGYRGDLYAGGTEALVWTRLEPQVLPNLPDHAGNLASDVNAFGVVVGEAIRAGNTYTWQGADPWIARRVWVKD